MIVAMLLNDGVTTTDLPFSHAIAYLKNRDELKEETSNIMARAFGGAG
jgi:hypothetical protein